MPDVTVGSPRPRLLDLFCGAGGVAAGYRAAGFEVWGVDHHPQPRYVGEHFIRGDAIEVGNYLLQSGAFDAVHASPPCQAHTDLQKQNKRDYPDFIPAARELLVRSGLPYVIENVEGAPLLDPIVLCGQMFHELRVYRHRLFESNTALKAPNHNPHRFLCHTFDKRKAHYGAPITAQTFFQVTGGGNATVEQKARAMDIDWMIGRELNEAVPPAYTRFLGQQLLRMLGVGALAGAA